MYKIRSETTSPLGEPRPPSGLTPLRAPADKHLLLGNIAIKLKLTLEASQRKFLINIQMWFNQILTSLHLFIKKTNSI